MVEIWHNTENVGKSRIKQKMLENLSRPGLALKKVIANVLNGRLFVGINDNRTARVFLFLFTPDYNTLTWSPAVLRGFMYRTKRKHVMGQGQSCSEVELQKSLVDGLTGTVRIEAKGNRKW